MDGKIKNIVLFGSRGKGLAQSGSDYDLLLVLAEEEHRIIDEIYDELLTFLIVYGIDISLKIYSEKDFRKWESIPTPFVAEVKKTGVELWS